jgi:hypothetical protein
MLVGKPGNAVDGNMNGALAKEPFKIDRNIVAEAKAGY